MANKSGGISVVDFKRRELRDSEKKFKRACIQIVLLNNRMEQVKFRYLRAKSENFRCFRYNLRLRLSVLEGIRNMFYDYAHEKAERVAELRHDIYGQFVEIVHASPGDNVNSFLPTDDDDDDQIDDDDDDDIDDYYDDEEDIDIDDQG